MQGYRSFLKNQERFFPQFPIIVANSEQLYDIQLMTSIKVDYCTVQSKFLIQIIKII